MVFSSKDLETQIEPYEVMEEWIRNTNRFLLENNMKQIW